MSATTLTPGERDLWIAAFAARCAAYKEISGQDAAQAANHASGVLERVNELLESGHPALDVVALGDMESVVGRSVETLQISGPRLAYARKMLGLSCQKAASTLGLPVTELAAHEVGIPLLPENLVRELCNLYTVDMKYLTDIDAAPTPAALKSAQERYDRGGYG